MKSQQEGTPQLVWQAKDSTKYLDFLSKTNVTCEDRILSYESVNRNNSFQLRKPLSKIVLDETKTFREDNLDALTKLLTPCPKQAKQSFPLLNKAQQGFKPNKQLWIDPLDKLEFLDNTALLKPRRFVQRSTYYVGPNAFNDSGNFKSFKIMDFDSDDDCQTAILSRMFKISLANSDEKANEQFKAFQEKKGFNDIVEQKKTCDRGNRSNVQEKTFENYAINEKSSVYTSMTNLLEKMAQISVAEDVAEEIHRKKHTDNLTGIESQPAKRINVQSFYKCRGYLKLPVHEEKETENDIVLFGIDGTGPNIKYESMSIKSNTKKNDCKTKVKHVGIQVKYSDLVNTTKAEIKNTLSKDIFLKKIEESRQLNVIKCTPDTALPENHKNDESHSEDAFSSDNTIDYTSDKTQQRLVCETHVGLQGTSETKPSWQLKKRLYPHLVLPELQTRSTANSSILGGCPAKQHVVTSIPTFIDPNTITHNSTNLDFPKVYFSRGFNFASCRGGLRYSKMIHRRKTH